MASPITLNSSAFLMLQQLELVTDSDGAQHGQPLDSWCLESHSREMCVWECACVCLCSTLCLCLVSWPYLCQVKSHVQVQLQLQQLLLLLQRCLPLVCPKWPSCYCCYDLWQTHIDQRFAPCSTAIITLNTRLTSFCSFSIDFLVFYLLLLLRP